jgi:hypothetical protein
MDERELLEMAAKAAGIVLFDGGPDARVPDECHARVWDRGGELTVLFYSDAGDNPLCKRVRPSGNVEWNPLTDDGDALRLGAAIGMDLTYRKVVGSDCGEVAVTARGQHAVESYRSDYMAATRRAIVRAAAALGKEQSQ